MRNEILHQPLQQLSRRRLVRGRVDAAVAAQLQQEVNQAAKQNGLIIRPFFFEFTVHRAEQRADLRRNAVKMQERHIAAHRIMHKKANQQRTALQRGQTRAQKRLAMKINPVQTRFRLWRNRVQAVRLQKERVAAAGFKAALRRLNCAFSALQPEQAVSRRTNGYRRADFAHSQLNLHGASPFL